MLRRAFIVAALLAATPSIAQTPVATDAHAALPRVEIVTDAGSMTVEVDTRRAPITGANFLRYVDEKRLDGTAFYRVVKAGPEWGLVQFGMQGDPKRTLPPIAHEPTTQTGISHEDGVLSIARLEPGTARGEFTIMVGHQTSLDANPTAQGDNMGYAAFARIIAGREVLSRILDTPVDPEKSISGAFAGEMPATPVRITSARRANTKSQWSRLT